MLKVGEIAIFRIDRAVVADGVIAAQRALALLLADRIDRHDPEDIDAHTPQARKVGLKGSERPLGRVLPDIDFIDVCRARPGRMADPTDAIRQRQGVSDGEARRRKSDCNRACRQRPGPRNPHVRLPTLGRVI